MKANAWKVVLRIGGADRSRVPELLKVQRGEYYLQLKKIVPGRTTWKVMDALLWVLATTKGLQVEGQSSELRECVLLTGWYGEGGLRETLDGMEGAMEDLQRVRAAVVGWVVAKEKKATGPVRIVNWCAGWSGVVWKVFGEIGLHMIAVDVREGMNPSEVFVQQDLLMLAPQFWRLEVARRMELALDQLGPNWIAIPCTTTARNDPSNKTRGGHKTFNNYRLTGDPLRKPQHPEGTLKGDLARAADRLTEAAWMMLEEAGQSYAIENPDGQLQYTEAMLCHADDLEKLDYCMLWSEEERERGLKWQKMCCLWARRAQDGARLGVGKKYKC